VLSGGRARRLGGARKAHVEVGGRAMLDLVLDAVQGAGVSRVVVVGDPPPAPRDGVQVTREEPAFGGPLAGLAAGLALVGADATDVLVLACDLPRAHGLVRLLLGATPAPDGPDGLVVVDGGGHEQWLAGRYSAPALRSALAAVADERGGDPGGAPVRAALGRLRATPVPDPDHASDDVDTPADLDRARRRVGRAPHEGGRP